MPEFSHHFRAMGTEVGLWLWTDNEQVARQALTQSEQFFTRTEAQLSRFKPDSELSRLNRSAGRPFTVSPLLFELIEAALAWRDRTNGIFDPTILNALIGYGYDRSFEELIEPSEAGASTAPLPAIVRAPLTLNPANRGITLPVGIRLDLGGIAKGWTVQQVATRLGQLGPALVDAGGDITCVGAPPTGSPWLVGLVDPHRPDTDLATLTLRNEAVATSSLARRQWQHQGQRVHHLIDPRTGAPAVTDLVSVTIISPRLPEAEIFAKVALILGAGAGLAYLEAQSGVSGLMVTKDGRQIIYGSLEEKAYVYSSDFSDRFVTLV
jgi:thiamine biosynthesis lipoprotein